MKKIFAVLLVVAMVLGAMPFALAEDCGDEQTGIERTSAYCPVCGDSLYYRTYTTTQSGSGNVCYVEVTYEQPYCLQHGDVYGAQEMSRHEYYHNWVTDYITGKPKCSRCGAYSASRLLDLECSDPVTFHRWATEYVLGAAKCVMCNEICLKPGTMTGECPNHSHFHCWTTDEDTGVPVCQGCGAIAK